MQEKEIFQNNNNKKSLEDSCVLLSSLLIKRERNEKTKAKEDCKRDK